MSRLAVGFQGISGHNDNVGQVAAGVSDVKWCQRIFTFTYFDGCMFSARALILPLQKDYQGSLQGYTKYVGYMCLIVTHLQSLAKVQDFF